MHLDELKKQVEATARSTPCCSRFTDMQGRLQGKRLTAEFFLDSVVDHGAEGCNYLLAVDVDMNTVSGYAMSSWERGYGDFEMKPDMDTLRDGAMAPGHRARARRPRVGRRQPGRSPRRARSCGGRSTGSPSAAWTAYAGTELEFMVFRNTYEEAWNKAYRDLDPANYYNVDYSMIGTARVEPLVRRIRNAMAAAGMKVENAKGECNFGQHEINFLYGPVLRDGRRPLDLQDGRQGDRRRRRAARSPTWRSSTSARATRATSTCRSPRTTTGRCSTSSFLAGQLACMRS